MHVRLYCHRRGGGISDTNHWSLLSTPPAAHLFPELAAPFTDADNQTFLSNGGQVGHFIIGDLNPNSWQGGGDTKFHGWVGEAGAWELSDPTLPTHEHGCALDRMLFLPGSEIPAFLLPPTVYFRGGMMMQGRAEGPFIQPGPCQLGG